MTPPDTAASFHLVTGEYPPDHGGVADYTQRVAASLFDAGCNVHVWCRGDDAQSEIVRPGLTVHRVAGSFDRAGLRRLTQALDAVPGPRIILLQYVAQSFGLRGMNIPFCFWILGRRRRGDEVRVMFHEVHLSFFRRPLRWNVISLAQRAMAATLLRAASKVYVSTAAWIPRLQRLGLGSRPVETLPVPSNFIAESTADQRAAARRAVSPDGAPVVGHFGTYGWPITGLLTPQLLRLLNAQPNLRIVLLGRGAAEYRRGILAAQPNCEANIVAFDDLAPDDVIPHIQAVDVMLQPFPDGASTRRGSLMACLAAAVPVVTTFGALSEPMWQSQTICPAMPVGDTVATVEAVRRLLADPDARRAAGRQAADYYDRHFSLKHTIGAILGRRPEPSLQPAAQEVADR